MNVCMCVFMSAFVSGGHQYVCVCVVCVCVVLRVLLQKLFANLADF